MSTYNINSETGLEDSDGQNEEEKIVGEDPKKPSKLRYVADYIFELVKIVVLSLAIIIPVRYFLIQPFYVKGASMEPNFFDHEYLIINEISYRFETPERGDIIVFKYPQDPSQYFIKRVIGLPNETVEIRESKITIYNKDNPNGIALDEKYLEDTVQTFGNKTFALGVDEYFALGDNRTASYDSRSFGAVNKSFIVGKVWVRGWPFDKIKVFETPEYNF